MHNAPLPEPWLSTKSSVETAAPDSWRMSGISTSRTYQTSMWHASIFRGRMVLPETSAKRLPRISRNIPA